YCRGHPEGYRVYFWVKDGNTWHEVERSDELLDNLTYNLLNNVEWGDTRASKPEAVNLERKSELAKHDFRQRMSARQFLDKTYYGRCIDFLRANNLAPKVGASARPIASEPS